MDKILSARVDEATAHRLGQLSRQLKKTKKAILEEAIQLYSQSVDQEGSVDPLDVAFGAWERSEKPEETVRRIRDRSRQGWRRHQT